LDPGAILIAPTGHAQAQKDRTAFAEGTGLAGMKIIRSAPYELVRERGDGFFGVSVYKNQVVPHQNDGFRRDS
jgi:hypothetical protein